MHGSLPVSGVRAALVFLLAPALASAATFSVNSTNDLNDGLCDASHCSLREAIEAANASAGADTIRFVIGSGPKTIQPGSPLPAITDPVTIDGTTQPGFAGAPIIELDGTNAGVGASGLQITAGSSVVEGLVINRFPAAFPSTGGHGIVLQDGGGNVVRGCYIGTNLAGTAALPNGGDGVQILSSSGNLVGRTSASFRMNVLSGNSAYGVRILGPGSDGNTIAGNRIGTNAAGTAAVPNSWPGSRSRPARTTRSARACSATPSLPATTATASCITGSSSGTLVTNCFVGVNAAGTAALPNTGQGVSITGTSGNIVGPGNLVSGNAQSGILMISQAAGNTVAGNIVGLNAAGTAAIANLLNGIIASNADDNTIGPGNVVAGNGTNGVRIRTGASGNVVKGNLIGVNTAAHGRGAESGRGGPVERRRHGQHGGRPGCRPQRHLGQRGQRRPDRRRSHGGQRRAGQLHRLQRHGLGRRSRTAPAASPSQAGSSGNTVGGTAAGTKNVIAFNGGRGVSVDSGESNAILGNTISFNALLGIDLGTPGVTPNDLGDPDLGANLLQNFPVLFAIQLDTATTQVQGSLNSIASSSYRLEFFSSVLCDTSGNGPGQRFLGFADRKTDPGGNVAFVAALASTALGPWITATATDSAGNTSEFSACLAVPGPTVVSIAPTSGPAGAATPVSIAGSNFQNGAAVQIGGAAAGGVAVMSGMEVDASTPVLPPGTLNDVTVTNPSSLGSSLAAGFLADFSDVPQANIFHDDVETVFRAAITAGCGAGNYCVSSAVTRAQMSVFLLKAEHGSAYLPPACTGVFLDVPCPSAFADWIEQLFAEGITAGCGGGNYCPDDPVRRDQMAVFLLKTKNGSAYLPPACTGVFDDVACPSAFADWIEQLYAEGITGGCSTTPLLYCPGASNTRGQMAVFLVKTFAL